MTLQEFNTCLPYAGAKREFALDQLRPVEERWIRQIDVTNEADYIIILCLQADAQHARNAQCLEFDMSFKMISGLANVMTCSGWDEEHRGEYMLSIYMIHAY